MKNPTIIDVAKQAGVSWKTVSRVVNGEPNVRPATAERVRAAIADLAYRPNTAARSLAGERTFLIAALTASLSAHYSVALHRGASGLCRERGFHLALEELDSSDPAMLAQFERAVATASFDGAIVPPPLCNDPAVLAILERYGVRYVLLDPIHEASTVPTIVADDAVGVDAMVDYAAAQGHRRFAFVDGPAAHRASDVRRNAYHAAIMRHVGQCEILSAPGAFTFASGMKAGERLFDRHDRPTFVFAANDDMAVGVVAAAHRAGLATPGDVSVAGFDDSEAAQLVWPSLTTVRQPISDIAKAAVEILISRSSPPSAVKTRFGVDFIIRGSTGAAPLT